MRYALLLFFICILAVPVHAETLIATSGFYQKSGAFVTVSLNGANFSISGGDENNPNSSSAWVVQPGETFSRFGALSIGALTTVNGELTAFNGTSLSGLNASVSFTIGVPSCRHR